MPLRKDSGGGGARVCWLHRVGPIPQRLRNLVDPLLFERGKEREVATRGLQFGDRNGLVGFSARQFVCLGEQHQKLQPILNPRANHLQQQFVQLSEPEASITQHHDARQTFATDQIVRHHLLPAAFGLLGHSGITVTGQVGEYRVCCVLLAERKQIDALRSPWCLRRESQTALLCEGIDAGRLTGI